ncbi:hypothetical protein [Pseudonocardia spirodelae]|uniref:O-antigen ligase domain-containing protein n=1 Tax=Pseudonocardia spirodelae TaxID=3133431 RepID=A0ABU8T2W6_9PSEU
MTVLREDPARLLDPADRRLVAAAAGTVCVVAAAGALVGPVAPAVAAALGLLVLTARVPAAATWIYLGALPFLSGIDRGRLVPLVRPNEALLVLLVAGVLAGAYLRRLRGVPLRLRFGPLDAPLALFLVVGTVWPPVSLLLRGHDPSAGDLAALLPLVKLTGLLLLARTTVVTPSQRRWLFRVVVGSAVVVAVVAVLQTLGFPPVLHLLGTLWTSSESPVDMSERGTTMFASSIATGDHLVLAVALLVGAAARGMVGRRTAVATGAVLAAGILATGQFSSWAAAAVAGVVLVRRYPPRWPRASRLVPAVLLLVAVGAPAVLTRLSEFGGEFGVPRSWLGRWDNLTSFYLPRIDLSAVLLGISPNSVLPAPETWREQIYLEFGYLQLLWVGGVALPAAFAVLSWHVVRRCAVLVHDPGEVGVAATAVLAAWWVVLILSVIDIHLTLRGTGDVLFVLLGIVGRPVDDDRVQG